MLTTLMPGMLNPPLTHLHTVCTLFVDGVCISCLQSISNVPERTSAQSSEECYIECSQVKEKELRGGKKTRDGKLVETCVLNLSENNPTSICLSRLTFTLLHPFLYFRFSSCEPAQQSWSE